MVSDPRLSKAERLQVFYAELAEAAAARTLKEAVDLVANTLLSVEDRFSGIERGDGIEDDGRMYPARLDNRRQVHGRPDLARLRSRAHNTYCSEDGAILIVDLRGRVEFSKTGLDGKVIVL